MAPVPLPAHATIIPAALTLLVACTGAAAPAVVLHLALGHAMRARGLARWRLADTLLVSPLLFLGLFSGFGALAYSLTSTAANAATGYGGAGGAHLAGTLAMAAGSFVVAGFGARAVGKLY